MGLYDIKPADLINVRNINIPSKRKLEPKIDRVISEIVGKQVLVLDPRLMKLVVKYKKMKKNPEAFDTYLQNPQFIKELKEVFNNPL